MAAILDKVHQMVWGAPMLVLILGVGIFLSVKTGFAQIRLFPAALRQFVSKLRRGGTENGVSAMQALCTALAATVGTGNLVGVAGAIALGGPGSIFWMWVCGLLGMATKFAEATLSVRFRSRERGEWVGGPMYMIRNGLGKGWKPLASVYCFFGVVAAFGVGNATQINAVITGVNQVVARFGGTESRSGNLLMGLLLAVLVAMLLLGGARRIGRTAEILVPVAACAYVVLCLGALAKNAGAVPAAFGEIIRGAFSPEAVTGGLIGSAFQALRVGTARGVFTNEAGMGTASIAHAGAEVAHPAEQGLMGIMEVFLDTIVICTLTALVILTSGVPIPYGIDAGGALTVQAFCAVYGDWAAVFLALALSSFAFATVLGWGLYGARCAEFLFGGSSWKFYSAAQAVTVMVSAVLETGIIWSLAETVNGLMAVPNLIVLVCLSRELKGLTMEYTTKRGRQAAGGTYENFNQCQPL